MSPRTLPATLKKLPAMKALRIENLLLHVKEYFLMALGMMLYSFGWIGCIMPARGVGGGGTSGARNGTATNDKTTRRQYDNTTIRHMSRISKTINR